ncbi:TIGR03435 family protein [Terriglobus roseus]|uniref:Soil-associated protein, TIGR03435 family n=1 Tax=Terriglobus roseus TaxID=392734 RepID=A0A1H4N1J8_9BACT|nr:TIGR03435 family protein [Terriglobus roseus]SEB89290.1 soil-associated protein, TIGR03435 family [Terriglobus roseus]
MRQNPVLRVALWLVDKSSSGPDAEAFAGDLLELFHAGHSQWWCVTQALMKSASATQQGLRALLLPLGYSFGFVFLHPLWQKLYLPSVAGLLARSRGGTVQWPGSAVLQIITGLVPAILFVWVGIFLYAILRRQSITNHPVTALLSLNVGVGLLLLTMLARLDAVRHDLRLLSRADFFYPGTHARFSVLLFLSLLGAVVILPRGPRRKRPSHRVAKLVARWKLTQVARNIGRMALLAPETRMMKDCGPAPARWWSGATAIRQTRVLLLLGSMMIAWPRSSQAQYTTPRLMASDGKPLEFEVVSVKPSQPGATGMRIGAPLMSGGLEITNMPPENIVQWAFGIFLSDQIVGLPDWAKQERFDVTAKVGDAELETYRKVTDPIRHAPMLQKILADRFAMKFHYETKELPVYALVVAKGGSRMTEIEPAIGPNGMKDGGGREVRRGQIRSMGQPMLPLVNQLTIELKRAVVDRTGLTGFYNFTLRWTPDEEAAPTNHALEENAAPSIFTALQEQLGLKLERTRAPMQVLVIDRLERPSVN